MEHLAVPPGCKPCETPVELIAREDYHGVSLGRYYDEFLPKYAEHEYNSFLQTWLFFCFLENALGDDFRASDFIRDQVVGEYVYTDLEKRHGTGRVLSTVKLNVSLQLLDHNFKTAKEQNDVAFLERLARVRWDFQAYAPQLTLPRAPRRGRSIEWFGSLWSVSTMVIDILNRHGQSNIGLDVRYNCEFPEEVFLERGWCLTDADRAWMRLSSFPDRYYWSQMTQPIRKSEDHSKCTRYRCDFVQIDLANYKLRHVNSGCKCLLFRVDPLKLVQILAKTPQAVLQIPLGRPSSIDSIEVVELITELRYLAVSHVWADGLGNSKENALHACQLDSLLTRLKPLHNAFCQGQDYMYVWVDSLCIPTEAGAAKTTALLQMKEIYRNATATLVLDPVLMQFTIELDSANEVYLQAAALIVLSRWMSRLWTLQEAILSRTLFFLFKGGRYYELGVLINTTLSTRRNCVSSGKASLGLVCEGIVGYLSQLLLTFDENGAIANPAWRKDSILSGLGSQVLTRALSDPSDEPICVSSFVAASLEPEDFPICISMPDFWKACIKHDLLDEQIIFHNSVSLKSPDSAGRRRRFFEMG